MRGSLVFWQHEDLGLCRAHVCMPHVLTLLLSCCAETIAVLSWCCRLPLPLPCHRFVLPLLPPLLLPLPPPAATTAAMTAGLCPRPTAIAPLLAPRSAAVAYCDGALAPLMAWSSLLTDRDWADNHVSVLCFMRLLQL